MTNVKIKSLFIIFTFLIFIFPTVTACSERAINSDHKFSSGYKLSEEEISELKEKLTDTEASDTPNVEITEATVFYWTDGGAKLHLFTDCQALSKSETSKIKQGLLEDAYYEDKTEPCSFCLKSANLTVDNFPVFVPSSETGNETTEEQTEQITSSFDTDISTETAPNDENIYIWTKNGTKLHIFESCTYLSKTSEENKMRGNKEAALEFGISEICSRCQKNAQETD